ncbi:hypothetical protein COY16_00815 [Candidatus Roizmanbacteria bacterium CG_4_10_14_0_2_um_filter_39_13]|uniref:Uncharacterized protein n=1 Tax=Candidatus Roizmanbacteria bacterium CG_4_10_14_0_2_um_filter_39_13 TaxID=1974825 RepID=A0A2M7U1R8_9BACT|nr:MAG: hypothetical protein COY16_00815 [Candidatus Roizmanbacteria bacterium CG_4_10_14_0_2_um_filter_39_13]
MSRVKLTEHKSKQLLYRDLNKKYHGVAVLNDSKGLLSFSTPLSKLPEKETYVVKVDQGVKGRMKKGLIELNVKHACIIESLKKLVRKGYSNFLIEHMESYPPDAERYVSIERTREGFLIRYASVGGIDIERMKKKIKTVVIGYKKNNLKQKEEGSVQGKQIAQALAVDESFINSLLDYCDNYFVSFLEINPLVVEGENIHILDLAIEVDSTARYFFRDGWVDQDVVQDQQKSPEEKSIKTLNDNSQAALSFTLLNQNGSVWVLLSGGGASITLADEFYNLGHGKDLGNYGEYSGNPTAEETYLYTKEVFKAMIKSKSKKKILLIGGGVANFTDVRTTFQGIIRALEDHKKELGKQKVTVYVRRGGPMQKEGLAMMEAWLCANNMLGYVAGPELLLFEIVRKVVNVL